MSTMDSIRDYIRFGLDPGGFATSLLCQDRDGAYSRAHPNLLNHMGEDIVANMLKLVATMPTICVGSWEVMEAWMSHRGLEGADDDIILTYQLSNTHKWW